MIDTYGRKYIQNIMDRVANLAVKKRISANNITIIALIVGIAAGILNYCDKIILSLVFLWISGFLDVLDGSIARINKASSDIGTLLDIFFDRIVEVGIILSFAISKPEYYLAYIMLLISILLSMTVFLTVGALAKNSGYKSFKYQVGIIERTEGFILFSLGILFREYVNIIFFIYAFLIMVTVFQRLYEGINLLRKD